MPIQFGSYAVQRLAILRGARFSIVAILTVSSMAAGGEVIAPDLLRSFATRACTTEFAQTLAGESVPKERAQLFCNCVGADVASSTSSTELSSSGPKCADAPASFSEQQKHFCGLMQSKGGVAYRRCESALAPKRELFYLIIGSEHYIPLPPQITGAAGFASIRGVVNGARHLQRALGTAGAKNGILLESREGEYVSREDVYGALEKIRSIASKSKVILPNSSIKGTVINGTSTQLGANKNG